MVEPLAFQASYAGSIPATRSMYAALTRTVGTAEESLEVATMVGEEMYRWLRDVDGFEGLLVLEDLEGGKTYVIALWQSREVAERNRVARTSATVSQRRSTSRSWTPRGSRWPSPPSRSCARRADRAGRRAPMLRYALARLVWTIPVVFVAVTLTFFLVRSIGGDPFRHGPLVGLTAQGGWQKYGDYQPQSIRDNMRRRYGLDLPWYEQYGTYLAGVATLNLGPSLSYRNRTVEQIIVEQGPITLELALLALTFALALGIPIGLVSGLHARSPAVALERVLTSLALALPAFFVGTMLIYLVAVRPARSDDGLGQLAVEGAAGRDLGSSRSRTASA